MDLALFDFDGTITRTDTMPAFVRGTAGWRSLPGAVALAPLLLAYRRGLVSGTTLRRAVACVAFAGADAARIEAAGDAFARTVLPPLVRPEAIARIDAHRARGDTVVVVSGGLDAYLAPWAASHGLPLLASSLEVRGSRLSGRYRGAQCVGDEKARRVRECYRIDTFDRIHAYGDTSEDAAMLAMAHHAYFRQMPTATEGLPWPT